MIDWTQPIEWSTGQPTGLAPHLLHTRSSKEVVACDEWENITGEHSVWVNAKTGVILGCEHEDYPFVRNRKPPASQQDQA
jgi:hypothetical protein